jgi:sulfonate transport system substrate-binding protein
MLSRHPDYSVSYVNAKTIQQQQQVADTFHAWA